MSGITFGMSANAFKTALDNIVDMTMKADLEDKQRAHASDELLFKQKPVDRMSEIVELFQGTGLFQLTGEQAATNLASPRVGNQKVINQSKYTNGFNISFEAKTSDIHAVYGKATASLALNALVSQDTNALQQYSLGFTTVLAPDGVALFSNSHVSLSGDTVDTLEAATAYSETTMYNMVVNLGNQLNQDGVKVGYKPKVLLVPLRLLKTAMEVTKSVLRAGTANNDLNYFSEAYPGLEVRYSPLLDTSSTTAYFLMSDNHGMTRFVHTPVTTALTEWQNTDTADYRYRALYMEAVAPVEYSGMVGSVGA